MMSPNRFSLPLTAVVTVALLSTLGGCASSSHVSMQVPAGLAAGTQPLVVGGKQGFHRSYQFGEFRTQEVKRGGTTSTRFAFVNPVFSQGLTGVRQRVLVRMAPVAGTAWQAEGAYIERGTDLGVRTGPNSSLGLNLSSSSTFGCVVSAPQQPSWELVLTNANHIGQANAPVGTFSHGDSVLQVRPIQYLLRRDGQPMRIPSAQPMGYEFVRPNGTPVAAVELLGRGRVWLAPTLAPEVKGPVAAAVTALLMRR